MKRSLLPTLLAAVCSHAQEDSPTRGTAATLKPAALYAAGAAGGLALAFLGAQVGESLENCPEDSDGFCGLGGVILGGLGGMALGTSLGVSLAGTIAYGDGHWLSTALGGVVGTFIGIYILYNTEGRPGVAAFFLLPPLFPTLTYHIARGVELRSEYREGGLGLALRRTF